MAPEPQSQVGYAPVAGLLKLRSDQTNADALCPLMLVLNLGCAPNADPRKLRSDLDADIPLHVRQYLAKYERCRTDLEALRDMETQIVVLRAVGEIP